MKYLKLFLLLEALAITLGSIGYIFDGGSYFFQLIMGNFLIVIMCIITLLCAGILNTITDIIE